MKKKKKIYGLRPQKNLKRWKSTFNFLILTEHLDQCGLPTSSRSSQLKLMHLILQQQCLQLHHWHIKPHCKNRGSTKRTKCPWSIPVWILLFLNNIQAYRNLGPMIPCAICFRIILTGPCDVPVRLAKFGGATDSKTAAPPPAFRALANLLLTLFHNFCRALCILFWEIYSLCIIVEQTQ